MKTTTVPVIIGALGLVKKGIENYIGKILGNVRITDLELQKTVLLGTKSAGISMDYLMDGVLLSEESIDQVIQQTYNCPKLMD